MTIKQIESWEVRIEKLYRRFPFILTWDCAESYHTHYCGLYVPDGWLPPIYQLLLDVETYTQATGSDCPVFRDIKDKRGLLSINYDGGDDYIDELVASYEDASRDWREELAQVVYIHNRKESASEDNDSE
jgi:hypothetical protein